MTNALDPNHMTPRQRLDEISEILATGFLRWKQKRVENSEKTENISLDLSSKQSLHVFETNDIFGDKP